MTCISEAELSCKAEAKELEMGPDGKEETQTQTQTQNKHEPQHEKRNMEGRRDGSKPQETVLGDEMTH